MVETREDVIGCGMDRQGGLAVTKGKRTKRQRASSPLALTMACTSSDEHTSGVSQASHNVSSSNDGGPTEGFGGIEEDMANCLILLSRGERMKHPLLTPSAAGPSDDGDGTPEELYQCKTCSRCFPSFQALGGHRASHKKPRLMMNLYEENDKKLLLAGTSLSSSIHDVDRPSFTELSLQMPTATVPRLPAQQSIIASRLKPKVHECSICRAEFTSGQALGGHMRRHRTVVASAPPTVVGITGSPSNISFEPQEGTKISKNVPHLDLNLPAPDEFHDPKYGSLAAPKEQVLVFSASPLIDCYY